jgi:hypothetical protein
VIVALLILLGVPVWVAAIVLLLLVFRNRRLRHRHGDIPVHVRAAGAKRWTRGHGIWTHDVFAFRGSPAAWQEKLMWVRTVTPVALDAPTSKKLHRLGADPTVVSLLDQTGTSTDVAVSSVHRDALLGALGRAASSAGAVAPTG